MRSKRKSRKLRNDFKRKKNRKNLYAILSIILVPIFVLIGLVWFKLVSLDKFSFVEKTEDGGGLIILIDNKSDRLKKIKIDPETALDLSQNLGVYKVKNLWKLLNGTNDNSLIIHSVNKNLSLPVEYYLYDGNTNMDFIRRLKVFLISLKDLDDNIDYIDSSDITSIDRAAFVLNELSVDPAKVEIIDSTGGYQSIDNFNLILSTMGFKVSGFAKKDKEEFYCKVGGRDNNLLRTINRVFGCEIDENINTQGDIVVILGESFSSNF